MRVTKPRDNIYKLIHKYTRAEINRIALLAGNTDSTNDKEIAYFRQEFVELIAFLNDHSHREETYIHPLLNDINSIELPLVEKEHQQLDLILKNLQANLNGSTDPENFYQFYLDLITFQSAYYNHLNNEERKLSPELLKNFSEEQLDKVNNQMLKEMPQEDLIKITKGMLPAINHSERVKIFSEMKASMPPPVLAGICELARSVLTSSQFQKLLEDTGIDNHSPKSNEKSHLTMV